MARKSSSPSLSELRERVALQQQLNALLREEVELRERLSRASKAPTPRSGTRSKTSARRSREPSSLSERAALQPRDALGRFLKKGQPRATTGQFLPERAPPPKEEPKPAQVVNWLVKTRIVTDRTPDDEDYDYADYSLWVVVNFDPQKNEKKMEDVLKVYRAWLQKRDPHVRWLSPKWQVSLTTLPPSARVIKEPPRRSGT